MCGRILHLNWVIHELLSKSLSVKHEFLITDVIEDTLNTIKMCNLQLFTILMPTCAKINHVLFLFPNSDHQNMLPGNKTQISEFILLGFSEEPALQRLLFGLFLSLYLITVVGNLLIILAIISDSHLHTPMYFFLSNLSFVEIGRASCRERV